VKGGWVHRKKRLRSDRYHDDQSEERNPMGYVTNKDVGGTTVLFFFTPVELYYGLKNTAVIKCNIPNRARQGFYEFLCNYVIFPQIFCIHSTKDISSNILQAS
jgi:hypothetical protein